MPRSAYFISINRARNRALQILDTVLPEDLTDQELNRFLENNKTQLRIEIQRSDVTVHDESEVFVIDSQGKRIKKLSATGLTSLSNIRISRQLGIYTGLILQDLVMILIHESGHHIGISQERDQFLDRLAIELISVAKRKNKDIHAGLEEKLIWSTCKRDDQPTRTPHCLIQKNYSNPQYVLFQLIVMPYGTCESTVISAGSFKQVITSVIENQQNLENSYNQIEFETAYCATVSLVDPLFINPIDDYSTPYCELKLIDANRIALFHSKSNGALLKTDVDNMKRYVNELYRNSFCGQGIKGAELLDAR